VYAKGFYDDELIAIMNDNSMFKQQACDLVKHHQLELLAQVLVSNNLNLLIRSDVITCCLYVSDGLNRLSWLLCLNAQIWMMS